MPRTNKKRKGGSGEEVERLVAKAEEASGEDNHELAFALCSQALALDPEHVPALALRARAAASEGRGDLDHAIELAPDYAMLHHFRAIYFQRGEEAIAGLTKATTLQPKNNYYLHFRGDRLAFRGDTTAALADLTRAMKLDPDFGETYLVRGKLHESMKAFALALADFKGALERLEAGSDERREAEAGMARLKKASKSK